MLKVLKEYSQKYEARISIMRNQPDIFTIKIIVAKMKSSEDGLSNRMDSTKTQRARGFSGTSPKDIRMELREVRIKEK